MNKYKKTYIIIALTMFVVCTSFVLLSLYERNKAVKTPIMSVGEHNVTQIEYSFYYNTIVNNFYNTYSNYLDIMNLDFSSDLYSQDCYFEGYDSWGTFFDNATDTALQKKIALYEDSQKNNYEYDYSKEYKNFKEQIKSQATSKNIKLSKMYETLFGQYANEKLIKQYYIEYVTATAYENYLLENTSSTDEEINSYYEDNKKDYDNVTYREYIIPADIKEDSSDDEIEEAMSKAKEQAINFYDAVYDEDTFINLCVDYSGNEEYKTKDLSLSKDKSYKEISGTISEWLFNCSEEKQTTIIEDTDNHSYHIVYFINRERDESRAVSIRQILIAPEISNLSDYLPSEEDYERALTKTHSILTEFEDKGKTEDAFKELAKEYSNDTGSSENGGLMANVEKGIYGETFDDWVFDDNRKNGDYTILQSSYGYHLVFFIDKGEPTWKFNIRLTLNSQKNKEYVDALIESYPITRK